MAKLAKEEEEKTRETTERREQEFAVIQSIYEDDINFVSCENRHICKLRICHCEKLYCVLCIILDNSYPDDLPISISIDNWPSFLPETISEDLFVKLSETALELKGEEVLHSLFELAKEFLYDLETKLEYYQHCPMTTRKKLNSEVSEDSSTYLDSNDEGASCSDIEQSSPVRIAEFGKNIKNEDKGDTVAYRAVTLDFLIAFASEHNLWHVPTYRVVEDIIIPTMMRNSCDNVNDNGGGGSGAPYTSILPPHQVGKANIFISHAWHNSFGLAVAAVRKYIGDRSHVRNKKKHHQKNSGHHMKIHHQDVHIWMDIFAITQQVGEKQIHDLSQLEPTIADENCVTLVVLDEEYAIPLNRCWCIFEIYATLFHSDLKYNGKLQVRVGQVVGDYGEFAPCSDRDKLFQLASNVNAEAAACTIQSDKDMILKRIHLLGGADRDGVQELNSRLQRAVRHGWS